MAYEPTKGFRDIVRQLLPGDILLVAGSYKQGTINLEKIFVRSAPDMVRERAPLCPVCGRRMTSAGQNKGFKCRSCSTRSYLVERTTTSRSLQPGWYEVPPSARRHLARPLCRGPPPVDNGRTYNLAGEHITRDEVQGDR
jgi:tRNA(Ile2)-agmatinylcytidine synthase